MGIQTIRDLLRQGDTGRALVSLILLLEKDSRFKDNLLRTLRVAEVNYNAVRQQELKGILSFQEAQREYSRVTDTVLAVLDDVEAGRVPTGASAPKRRLWYALGGAVAVVALVLLGWKFLRSDTAECPAFNKKEALHILVLPFDNLGSIEARPHTVIQGMIAELTGKANIPVEVQVSTRSLENASVAQNAQDYARECQADLVVFGQYKAFEKDSIRVKMGFRFLKGGGPRFDGPFKAFDDITEVRAERDLEDAITKFCGLLAVRNRKWQFAQ
ncbi:MAG: hypothetical protein IT260_22850, partial [Saprospiraceae bacterium]|nr:hypothetical protein [Saprospiraceae bacterium]